MSARTHWIWGGNQHQGSRWLAGARHGQW